MLLCGRAQYNSHVQHTIQQFEIWETGEVLIVAGEVNQRLPYSFRRDFSIEAVAPANIGCPGKVVPQNEPEVEDGISEPAPSPTSRPSSPSSNCIAIEQGPLAQTDHFFEGQVHVVQLWRQNGDTPWGSESVSKK